MRLAGPDDLSTALHIDSTAFGLDRDENRRWLEPLLSAERVEFALGELDGHPAGTAYVLRSDGAAGPSAYVAGVAVLPEARRRGVGAGVSSWLLERAFERGAELAHLNPDTDAAARIYGRLGFTELSGHRHLHRPLAGSLVADGPAVAADVAVVRRRRRSRRPPRCPRCCGSAGRSAASTRASAAGAEHVVVLGVALAERELDLAAVDEVELLLAVVVVRAARVARAA